MRRLVDESITSVIAQTRNARNAKTAARGIAQRFQDDLFSDVDAVCRAHAVRAPGGFLAEIMAGVDPRAGASRVRALVDAVEARGVTETPTEEEWFELAELIKSDPRYDREPISLDLSYKAARDLAGVLYNQRHTVQAQADITATTTPLTKEELDEFRKWFDGKY